jgi:hypothetical protein
MTSMESRQAAVRTRKINPDTTGEYSRSWLAIAGDAARGRKRDDTDDGRTSATNLHVAVPVPGCLVATSTLRNLRIAVWQPPNLSLNSEICSGMRESLSLSFYLRSCSPPSAAFLCSFTWSLFSRQYASCPFRCIFDSGSSSFGTVHVPHQRSTFRLNDPARNHEA